MPRACGGPSYHLFHAMLQWILLPAYPFSLVFLVDRAYRVLFPMHEQLGFLYRGRWAGRAGEPTPPFSLLVHLDRYLSLFACLLYQVPDSREGVGTSTQFYGCNRGTNTTQQRRETCSMTRQKKTIVCPIGGGGVGGKWKFWIMYHLLNGPKRFGELQRLFPQVSRQMLTIQLRELEQIGILHRQIYIQVPPKVEYRLSEVGQRLEPILRQMDTWGQWYTEQGDQEVDWLVSLGGRWTFWIWYHLLSGPKRFGELQKLLPQISQHMLILKLREL